tara:strand:+ start:1587 stop:3245 length:1659 start_codon:yes stop_codon:yes gene_type:complete
VAKSSIVTPERVDSAHEAVDWLGKLDSKHFLDETREKFRRDFFFACRSVFEFSFAGSWLSYEVHKPLCDALQDPEKKRLAVVFPRDWLKSTVCSIYYPVWRAMLDDTFTCMIVLNTFTNASKKLLAIRKLILESPLLPLLFPERMPTSSSTLSTEAITLPRTIPIADATFEAAGAGTQVTSRHHRCIIEDDTVAPEIDNMTGDVVEPTPEQVEKAIGFHKVAHFLLNDFKTDRRIVVGTRWAERDLFSHIREKEPQYKWLSRAAKELEDGTPSHDGECVYPERFDDEVLDEIRSTVGEYMFSSLMLNLPINPSTRVFQDEWIKFYDKPPQGLVAFTTVDPAPNDGSETGSDPDYNVVLTAGIQLLPGTVRIYVLDYFRDRCNPKKLIDQIFTHNTLYQPMKVGIETVAYQKTLAYWLKEMQTEKREWFSVEELKPPRKSKAHVYGLQPMFEAARIFIQPWMTELRQELLSFPRGAHDDLVDALAYQQKFWKHAELVEQPETPEMFQSSRSGASLIHQLYGRHERKKGFPFDCQPGSKLGLQSGLYGERYHTN